MKKEEIIETARKNFEESFKSKKYYEMQTQDNEHLRRILDSLLINNNSRVLDLGTGSGYLAFPIAESHVDCEVVGLDIVVDALENNRNMAKEEGLDNLTFVS